MIKLNQIKRAKSAASESRNALPGVHLTISKKRRDTSTDQLTRDFTRAMNLDRRSQADWDRQAAQNVSVVMAEYEAKTAMEAAARAAAAAADAEFAAKLGAMNLAGYKRKTSKKSHKRHSSRKKHRKRRTRRH